MVQYGVNFANGFGKLSEVADPMVFAVGFIFYANIQAKGMAVEAAVRMACVALMKVVSSFKIDAFGEKTAGHGIPSILCVCRLNRHCGLARQ